MADPSSTVFLGRALEKQGKLDEAASTYTDATKIKSDDELGWKGLCAVYSAQGARGVAKHTEASLALAQLHAEKYVCLFEDTLLYVANAIQKRD